MRDLTISDVSVISGAGAESYRMAVNREIAEIMIAQMNQCNVKDLTQSMIASALASGAFGAFGGSVTVPVIGAVPGWAVGAVSGAGMAAFTYGMSCWW